MKVKSNNIASNLKHKSKLAKQANNKSNKLRNLKLNLHDETAAALRCCNAEHTNYCE